MKSLRALLIVVVSAVCLWGQNPKIGDKVGPSTAEQLADQLAKAKAKQSEVGSANGITWDTVVGKPTAFTPTTHTQAISTIIGLQTALDGKALANAFTTINGQVCTLGESCTINTSATQPYGIHAPIGEAPPTVNQVMLRYPVPTGITWTIATNCTNSLGVVETAATGSTVFSLQKCTGAAFTSCTEFGTVTFAASGTSATFSCTATSFTGGTDALKVVAPASSDTTLSKGAIEVMGTR